MTSYEPRLLTVVRANEQQQRRAHLNTFTKWGQPLGISVEDWVAAGEQIGKGIWIQEGSVLTWVLVPRDDADGDEHILSHCMTYRLDALIAHPDSPSVHRTNTYIIGWVFTPEEYRRAGHANHLLSLLHYVLAPKKLLPPFPGELWGAEPVVEGFHDASFSVLHSGIGPSYYTKVRIGRGPASREGWTPTIPNKRVWDVTEALKSLGPDREGLQWILREHLPELADPEAKEVEREVNAALAAGGRGTKIALIPSNKSLLTYTAFLNYAANPSSDRTYAVHLPPSPSALSSAETIPFLTYLPVRGTLSVTFVVGAVPWAVVLQAARRESCTRVEVWGEMGDRWNGEVGVSIDPEDGPIPAVALYEVGAGGAEVEWVCNAKGNRYSLF